MEVNLLHVAVAVSLCVIHSTSNGFVNAQSLYNNCLQGLLKTELKPCSAYGRQRLAPCTINEDKDLTTLLISDAFRVHEVGGEYVPRSTSMNQVQLNSVAFPTASTLYFIPRTMSVTSTAVCVNGVASPHTADMCRVLYAQGLSFDDAKVKCETEGGLVLSIQNRWDQDHLPAINSEVWIGFKHLKESWTWHGTWKSCCSSELGEYINLVAHPGQGNDGAYMRHDGKWVFTNQYSDALKPFVCERTKPTVGCGTGYTTVGEKCYKYILVAMTLPSARQHCEAEDAYLVNVISETEQTAVYQFGLNREIWIGLQLIQHWNWPEDRVAQWHSGMTGHNPWVPGKPVREDRCATLLPDGTWNSTADCNQLKGVICDIPKVPALQWNNWTPSSVAPWDAESTAVVMIEGTKAQECPIKQFAFNTGKRSDCLQTHRGFLYLGSEDKTFDGDQCQRWDTIDSSYPYPVPQPQDMNTKTSVSDLENYCATSVNFDYGPMCETQDPDQGPKPCNIPTCPFVRETTCKTTRTGKEYEGTLSTAFDGTACLPWNTIEAVAALWPYFPEKNLTLAENYCRNPTNDGFGPYCYTASTTRVECNIPICEWISHTTCRANRLGWDYIGQIATTVTGAACRPWVETGFITGFTTDRFPEKTSFPLNYCRNPNYDSRGPWCYSNSYPHYEEYCLVPICENVRQTKCKTSSDGWEYQGTHNVDHTGRACKLGNTTSLSASVFTDGTSSAAVNHCRSPGNYAFGPFCIVDNGGSEQYSFCDIPVCDEVKRTTCRTSPTGWEYAGTQAVTASGHPCQRWDSQSPNTHSYSLTDGIPASWLPDNYCRNLDLSEYGPWCYKADEVGKEHCDIPLCEDEY